jgi:hypothetical protein
MSIGLVENALFLLLWVEQTRGCRHLFYRVCKCNVFLILVDGIYMGVCLHFIDKGDANGKFRRVTSRVLTNSHDNGIFRTTKKWYIPTPSKVLKVFDFSQKNLGPDPPLPGSLVEESLSPDQTFSMYRGGIPRRRANALAAEKQLREGPVAITIITKKPEVPLRPSKLRY